MRQYVLFIPAKVSSKSVPPTETLEELDPKPVIPIPETATSSSLSQNAVALSPEATKTDTPSVTACWKVESNAVLAAAPFTASHFP